MEHIQVCHTKQFRTNCFVILFFFGETTIPSKMFLCSFKLCKTRICTKRKSQHNYLSINLNAFPVFNSTYVTFENLTRTTKYRWPWLMTQ